MKYNDKLYEVVGKSQGDGSFFQVGKDLLEAFGAVKAIFLSVVIDLDKYAKQLAEMEKREKKPFYATTEFIARKTLMSEQTVWRLKKEFRGLNILIDVCRGDGRDNKQYFEINYVNLGKEIEKRLNEKRFASCIDKLKQEENFKEKYEMCEKTPEPQKEIADNAEPKKYQCDCGCNSQEVDKTDSSVEKPVSVQNEPSFTIEYYDTTGFKPQPIIPKSHRHTKETLDYKQLEKELAELWNIHPCGHLLKRYKLQQTYNAVRENGVDFESMKKALIKFNEYERRTRGNPQFFLHLQTWLENKGWENDMTVKDDFTPLNKKYASLEEEFKALSPIYIRYYGLQDYNAFMSDDPNVFCVGAESFVKSMKESGKDHNGEPIYKDCGSLEQTALYCRVRFMRKYIFYKEQDLWF